MQVALALPFFPSLLFVSSMFSILLLIIMSSGNMAGPTIQMSAPTFRQANFVMCGSGLGSVSQLEMRESLGELAVLLAQGKLTYPVEVQPFEKVQEVWDQKEKNESRLVFVWNK